MRAVFALLVTLACSLQCASAATGLQAQAPGAPLTLTLTPLDGPGGMPAGPDALLDLGPVSASGQRMREIVIRRRVAVRIDSAAGGPASARLSVLLNSAIPGSITRVDGMTVSTVPRMISPTHRIGTPVVHEIEIRIPASAPAGDFASDLLWLVETD